MSLLPKPTTVREVIARNYSYNYRARMAQERGDNNYSARDHLLARHYYKEILSGRNRIGSLYNDERQKLKLPRVCVYCGASAPLSLDHLIPRLKDRPDASENLVPACRSCNSSKGGRDLIVWLRSKGRSPSILLFRRYLKLTWRWCEANDCLDRSLAEHLGDLPIDINALRQVRWPARPDHLEWF